MHEETKQSAALKHTSWSLDKSGAELRARGLFIIQRRGRPLRPRVVAGYFLDIIVNRNSPLQIPLNIMTRAEVANRITIIAQPSI